ncbi:retrovirus-related pol polyprotein from transposon TNT 1-94 [Tanacetum coccineum]
MYVQRIQEVLVYVTYTCPSLTKPSKKLVAVTLFNKNKKVRFTELATSSSNTHKQADSHKTQYSNKLVLPSTGMKSSTSASRSQPLDNTKNNRISRTTSSNPKNKVEDHPRSVKSNSNKKNRVVEAVVQIVLWYFDSGCSKHMTGNRSQLINFVHKFLGTVRFGKDQIAKIMGYEVAFRKQTCYIRDLEGVDLLKGSRGSNLYTLSLEDMMLSSPICLLSKASKTKFWLWHRRLSHLNFDSITALAKQGLVRGLPKLKFQKDHLCSAYALGKSKKHSHKPKAKDSIQEKLYLLHMDLCGPMRIQMMASEQFSSKIGPQLLTPGTISSGLVPNPPSPPSVTSPVPAVVALEPADSTGTPSSTTIDQDAPSLNTSETLQETQSPVIPLGVVEEFHNIEVAHLDNDPFFGVPIPKPNSEESSLRDVIHLLWTQ